MELDQEITTLSWILTEIDMIKRNVPSMSDEMVMSSSLQLAIKGAYSRVSHLEVMPSEHNAPLPMKTLLDAIGRSELQMLKHELHYY